MRSKYQARVERIPAFHAGSIKLEWQRLIPAFHAGSIKQVCLVCGQPSGHWRHWPNVPGEHYVVPVHAEQSDFHSFQG